jgi:hypothetical protein
MFDRLKHLLGISSGDVAPMEPLPDLPFGILAVPGAEVAARLAAERSPRIYPILLGDRQHVTITAELIRDCEDSPTEIEHQGLALDIVAWLKNRPIEENNIDYYAIDDRVTGKPDTPKPLSPARKPLSNRPKEEVFIGLVPVEHSWLVPAHVKPGGWNSCPEPAVHVALFRHWHERYGAEVTTIANDVIEFTVARPPTNHADARTLAIEQFLYCGDLVQQGTGTVGNLAALLIDNHHWYFWWD